MNNEFSLVHKPNLKQVYLIYYLIKVKSPFVLTLVNTLYLLLSIIR